MANVSGSGDDQLLIQYLQDGTQNWVALWTNTSSSSESANCVTVDGSGNVYVAGATIVNGNRDVFVRKYNAAGVFQWNATTTWNSSGTQSDELQFMKINSAGTYLYLTGFSRVSGTNHNVFLLKVRTSDGSYLTSNGGFAVTWDSSPPNDIDETYSLDFDASENIYLAGRTQLLSGGYDGLILKYNSSGVYQYNTMKDGTNSLDDAFASIDVTSDVYVTGYTQINTSNNDANYLTCKYTTTFSPQWTATYDGSGTQCPNANDDIAYMLMVGTSGKVYVTGRSFETSGLMNNTSVRYSSTGTQEWTHSYDRGSVDNYCETKYPMDLVYDPCRNQEYIYIAGYTNESAGYQDATTIKYSPTGTCDGPERLMSKSEEHQEPTVYPNPFARLATFKFGNGETVIENATFIIYDLMGKEIKRIENVANSEFEIDMTGKEHGVYFYKFFQSGAIIATGKFIVSD